MEEKNKILYIDTETGGLNSETSALLQLSGIIEINGEIKETFNYLIKPFKDAEITDTALEIQDKTIKDLEKGEEEKDVHKKFVALLDKYIDKYDKNDKFIVAGYNVNFDINMLQSFFKRNNDNYLYSYLSNKKLDPLFMIPMLQVSNQLPVLENDKLETWCKFFDIELNAHDSMNDIMATKQLLDIINNIVNIGREIIDADYINEQISTYRKREEDLHEDLYDISSFVKDELCNYRYKLHDLPSKYRPTTTEIWDCVSFKISQELINLKEFKKRLLYLGFEVEDKLFGDKWNSKRKKETVFNKYKKLFKIVEKEYL